VVVLDLEDVGGERQWQMAESGGGGQQREQCQQERARDSCAGNLRSLR
jgi:hypothetical protein